MNQRHDIDELLRPGVISRDGFLGSDPRTTAEIIASDAAAMQALGVTPAALADLLEGAMTRAFARQGAPVALNDHATAEGCDAKGAMPCPFSGSGEACGTLPKGEAALADACHGTQIIVTPLSIHLLRRHGFCEGRGSRYRIEPAAVAAMFNVKNT